MNGYNTPDVLSLGKRPLKMKSTEFHPSIGDAHGRLRLPRSGCAIARGAGCCFVIAERRVSRVLRRQICFIPIT